jgi:hypothetical protein
MMSARPYVVLLASSDWCKLIVFFPHDPFPALLPMSVLRGTVSNDINGLLTDG